MDASGLADAFVAATGSDRKTAEAVLRAHGNDLNAAVGAYFDGDGGDREPQAMAYVGAGGGGYVADEAAAHAAADALVAGAQKKRVSDAPGEGVGVAEAAFVPFSGSGNSLVGGGGGGGGGVGGGGGGGAGGAGAGPRAAEGMGPVAASFPLHPVLVAPPEAPLPVAAAGAHTAAPYAAAGNDPADDNGTAAARTHRLPPASALPFDVGPAVDVLDALSGRTSMTSPWVPAPAYHAPLAPPLLGSAQGWGGGGVVAALGNTGSSGPLPNPPFPGDAAADDGLAATTRAYGQKRQKRRNLSPPPGGARKKRARVRLHPHQLEHLERMFTDNQYPSRQVCETTADELALPAHSVIIWFQNRRAKRKRTLRKKLAADAAIPVTFAKQPNQYSQPEYVRTRRSTSSNPE